jgi:hypothetical protein
MDRELQGMIASIGKVEVALVLAMAGAAEHWLEVVQRRCVNTTGSERKSAEKPDDPDREGVKRFEQDAARLYCSYLRDLASVARVCAFSFLSTFEQLRDRGRVAEPLAGEDRPIGLSFLSTFEQLRDGGRVAEPLAREDRPIGFRRGFRRKGPGSKHFMHY